MAKEESVKKGVNMKFRNLAGVGVMALALSLSAGATMSEAGTARIQKQVRHELNMLPYANVFDYMTFTVDENGAVTLNGEVTNPVLKSDAANVTEPGPLSFVHRLVMPVPGAPSSVTEPESVATFAGRFNRLTLGIVVFGNAMVQVLVSFP